MYVKTQVQGEAVTVTGNPAVVTGATPDTFFSNVQWEVEPLYSGSGTPSLVNIRPISSSAQAWIKNTSDNPEPDEYFVEFDLENCGTVYGGIVNLTEGTLTVTKVAEVVTTVSGRVLFDDNRRFTYVTAHKPKYRGSQTYTICDKIATSWEYCLDDTESADGIYVCAFSASNVQSIVFCFPKTVADTLQEAQNWMAQYRPTVCYELDEPIVYPINRQNVIVREGTNTLFSATNVSVSYTDYDAKYTDIRDIVFEPEVDISSSEVPINEFTVDIVTQDNLVIGREVRLYDNSDNLWAKYWVYSADRISTDIVRLNARSILWKLDNRTMYQSMYNEELATTVINRIFRDIQADYSIDASFDNVTISGYLPQGSARERLHKVCFAIGAYVKTFFNDVIEILPIDTTATVIPQNKTFWRPSVEYSKYVTEIQVSYYKYEEKYPNTTDEWVEVNGKYYVITKKTASLTNPNVPAGTPDNVVTVDDIGIINEDNVDDVLFRLSSYYFQRIVLTADVIDNGEYIPANLYTIATGIDAGYPMITGYMASAAFSFGHQARAKIRILQAQEVESVDIDISYEYNGNVLETYHLTLPDGHQFEVDNPYVVKQYAVGATVYWMLYYPAFSTARGVAIEGGVYRQEYGIAIQHNSNYAGGELYINEVDDIEKSGDTLIIKGGEESYE